MAVHMEAVARISAQDQASLVLAQIGRNFDKLSRAADQINRRSAGGDSVNAQLERRAALMSRVSSIVATAAAGSMLASPAIVTAAVVRATKAYAEQERAMSRIAITGDATRAQQDQAALSVERLADKTGLASGKVREGLDSLVAAGRKLPEAMQFLPSVARTAQAAGAEVVDIAKSADAVGSSFGIASGEMQGAFDLMAAAGKEGKFEMKDMARYLPSLAPAAAQMGGMRGMEGLKQLVALLQIVRAQSGTSEEAATNMANIFGKLDSDETRKKFKDMGVDSAKALEKAKKEGRNLVEVMAELVQTATKGDLSKIPRLFQDLQVQKAMIALTSQTGEYKDLLGKLANTKGTVDRDLVRVLADTQTGFDRVSASATRFVQNLGNIPAVKGALGGVADGINAINTAMERGAEIRRELDAAGLKPIQRTISAPAAQADAVIARAKRENDPQYWAGLRESDEDEAARRGKRGGAKPAAVRSASSVEAAYGETRRARQAVEDERRESETNRHGQRIADNAREAADIAREGGAVAEALASVRRQIDAQREQGDTYATVSKASDAADGLLRASIKRLADLEAYADGRPDVLPRKRASAPDSIRDAVEASENERRRLAGGTVRATPAEIDAQTAEIVAAVRADPQKFRDGQIPGRPLPSPVHPPPRPQVSGGVAYGPMPPPPPPPPRTPEKLVATVQPDQIRAQVEPGQVTADVKPDQVTAKLEGRVDTQVNVTVTPSENFIVTVTNRVKQAIGPLNAQATTGQANP